MRPVLNVLLLTGLVLPGAPSATQDKTERAIRVRFAQADLDHDGKLTREEARRGMPRVYASFDRIDRAHKGYVTVEEILAALKEAR